MVIEHTPLEDELGDVLDKALQHAGLTEAVLSERTGVSRGRIRDAIDYRYDLSEEELGRIAEVLRLNRGGFLALAAGRYPLPAISGLPFCLFPLRTPHGIGVANAYIAADCSQPRGVLFDAGSGPAALRRAWPARIRELDAIFITHPETEHMGGLAEVRETRGRPPVFAPAGSRVPGATQVGDGAKLEIGGFIIAVLATPGHAEAHNSYLVRARTAPTGTPILFSGDLLFAGSVGGAFFCRRRLRESVERLVRELPPETVVASGHGPLTTLAGEAANNPFLTAGV